MNKLLTVSIAAYNVEAYLQAALEPFLSCELRNMLEVIIVNDGSTDKTLEIAQNYESRFPEFIKVINKPNGGYGSTINASLAVAKGKYYRFLDGDDWFDGSAITALLDVLANTDSDAVTTMYVRRYVDGSEPEYVDDLCEVSSGTYPLLSLNLTRNIAAHSLTYRTDFLKSIEFRMTERCFYTDTEYAYLPFKNIRSVTVTKIPLYQYRLGREGQSVSLKGITKHYKDIICVCARLFTELGDGAGDERSYFARCIQKECLSPYNFLLRIKPSKEHKAALMEFDELLKSNKELYSLTAERSKKIALLRMTHFLAYFPICAILSWRAR